MVKLKHDGFWDCVVGAENFDRFKKNIVPSFAFKKAVPDEVKKSFGIVEKLLHHAYFEYDFLDPAMAKALYAFEMALRMRYEEITGKKSRQIFQQLLDYYHTNGFFEFDREEFLNVLRSFRNDFAHPRQAFEGGFGLMNIFNHCIHLINDSYEHPVFRKLRTAEKEELNSLFKEISAPGCIVTIGEDRRLVYDAGVYLVDNLSSPKKIYGYIKMIFPLEHEKESFSIKHHSLLLIKADDYKIDITSGTKIIHIDDSFIKLESIHDVVNRTRFDEWKTAYQSSEKDWMQDMNMDHELDKQWAKARKAMHLRNETYLTH